MARIAIDFDGTLVQTDATGAMAPVDGAAEALAYLRSLGHEVVIYTCRVTVAQDAGRLAAELALIERTLRAFRIPFDEVYTGTKMVADAYVDDRAVPFEGAWRETVAGLTRLVGPPSRP